MKQQVKNIRTKVKEAKLMSVYSNFGQKAPKEIPVSIVSRFLPKHVAKLRFTSSPSSRNKQNDKLHLSFVEIYSHFE